MSTIVSPVSVAELGALVGDTARAKILSALMGGQALTAGELAWHAGISGPTASGHLGKLAGSGLLALERQGRHRYYRLASPLVGQMLEGISAVASMHGPQRYRPRSRIDEAMRTARTCYDHLAGRLGVAIADGLVAREHLVLSPDGGAMTESGDRFLADLGIDTAERPGRRCFCRPCLDWSERRPHLAGALGARLASRVLELGWVSRVRDSRAVEITAAGEVAFADLFGFRLEADEDPRSLPRSAP